MNFIEAIVLGIIQGLTEFLPISSSGHLEIGKALFRNETIGQESLFLTLVLHLGTAMSTLVVFRNEILQILKGLFQLKWNEDARFSLKIILSMLPAAVVGLFSQDQIEALFSQNLVLVGGLLLVTAGAPFFSRSSQRHPKKSFLFQRHDFRASPSCCDSSRNFQKWLYYSQCSTFRSGSRKSSTFFLFNGATVDFWKHGKKNSRPRGDA
jgi:undecaprenyl pyrophosphate phosphatase UppP